MLTILPCSTRYVCRSCNVGGKAIRYYSNQKTLKISGRRIPTRRVSPGFRAKKGEKEKEKIASLRRELKVGVEDGSVEARKGFEVEKGGVEEIASQSGGVDSAGQGREEETPDPSETDSKIRETEPQSKKTRRRNEKRAARKAARKATVANKKAAALDRKSEAATADLKSEAAAAAPTAKRVRKKPSPATAPKVNSDQFVKDLEACDGPKKTARRNAVISKAPLEGLVALVQSGKLNEKEKALVDMFMKVRMSVKKYMTKPKEDDSKPKAEGQELATSEKGESLDSSGDKEQPATAAIRIAKLLEEKREKISRRRREEAGTETSETGQTSLQGETGFVKIRHSVSDAPAGELARKKHDLYREKLAENAAAKTAAKRATRSSKKSLARAAQVSSSLTRRVLYDAPSRGYEVEVEKNQVRANHLELVPLEKEQPPVPALAYGLDRVLFNPGVYNLRDPRSRVFNFDPYLETIMPVSEFDFNALKEYITSSRDEVLISTAREANKKYTGSTSSMTTALAHFHFLLSQWRPINTAGLSNLIDTSLKTFTALQRCPSAVFLRWKDGVYAIDADKEFDTANILMMLGKSMEKQLTLPTEAFEKYRKSNSHQISEEERNEPEAFHYTTMGDFLMRSQLDAYDPRLPGSGMFDLKTRAVVSIRMDAQNYKETMDYEIRKQKGEYESYEREFYDMIRAAFLKYSLQVRMGRMDGIFVAFHNTQRIFGFQYISLPEMDFTLHGTEDTTIGDSEFKLSIDLLNKVLDQATKKFPEQSLRLHFETKGNAAKGAPATKAEMYIHAEPVTDEQIEAIQATKRAEIDEFHRQLLGLDKDESSVVESQEEGSEDMEAETELVEDEANEDSVTLVASSDDEGALTNDNVTAATEVDVVEEDAGDEGIVADIEAEEAMEEVEESDELEESEVLEEVEKTQEFEELKPIEEEEDADLEVKEIDLEEEIHLSPAESTDDSSLDDYFSELQRNFKESTTDSSLDDYFSELHRNFQEPSPSPPPSRPTTPNTTTHLTEYLSTLQLAFRPKPTSPPLLSMILKTHNKVNGDNVQRPERLTKKDKWSVDYQILEVSDPKVAWRMYENCQKRRMRALGSANDPEQPFLRMLRGFSERGRVWREEERRRDLREGVRVYGVEGDVVVERGVGEEADGGVD